MSHCHCQRFLSVVSVLMVFNSRVSHTAALLYPRESETREIKSLDGIWNFVKSNQASTKKSSDEGMRNKWYLNDLNKVHKTIPMPVPASYNDITESLNLADHVGTVWYDRRFFVPPSWANNTRVWIRFGSVHYEAQVFVNGIMMVKHEIGHLPFEADVTDVLKYGEENRVTVSCNNALLENTMPQGKISNMKNDNKGTSIVQKFELDFFNYAGIDRSVVLYTTPTIYIVDIITSTEIIKHSGRINYQVVINTKPEESELDFYVTIQMRDRDGNIVAETESKQNDLKGHIDIGNAKLWWPYLMHPEPGYLYTMEVFLSTTSSKNIDVFRLKIGIRSLQWNSKEFLINGKPVYFRGFGRHEDSNIRGKGLDMALLAKDFNLMKWIGANAYRTTHYPHSEETMQLADENGIMMVNECSGTDSDNFSPKLLEKHKQSIRQLIDRDKNHACVVMWSIGSERTSKHKKKAGPYFEAIAKFTKSLDPHRPITATIAVIPNNDKAGEYLDVISFNRYHAWFTNPGELETITPRVVDEAIKWNKMCKKPVLMAEFGADALEGLHLLPSFIWSEEFQLELLSKHFEAFDKLRSHRWFVGEFIWNFADFKTFPVYTRLAGNKKGIFTRSRQPKMAAYHVRKRYFTLAEQLDQAEIPDDLFPYFANQNKKIDNKHTEL